MHGVVFRVFCGFTFSQFLHGQETGFLSFFLTPKLQTLKSALIWGVGGKGTTVKTLWEGSREGTWKTQLPHLAHASVKTSPVVGPFSYLMLGVESSERCWRERFKHQTFFAVILCGWAHVDRRTNTAGCIQSHDSTIIKDIRCYNACGLRTCIETLCLKRAEI